MYTDNDNPFDILPPVIRIAPTQTNSSRQIRPNLSSFLQTSSLSIDNLNFLIYLLLTRIDVTSHSA